MPPMVDVARYVAKHELAGKVDRTGAAAYAFAMTTSPPVALTIAGSDCSAGAGLQADLKTFQHFGVHGLTAVTCVVSETANCVRQVHPVPVAIVQDQIALLLESFPVAAVKTGMLFSAAHVRAVAEVLAGYPGLAVVVDPVMIASTGDALLEPEAIALYQELLLPLARLITPNLPEAAVLLGTPIPDLAALEAAARRLGAVYRTSVLLKGGHLAGPECTDLLLIDGEIFPFTTPRLALPGSHGTGCTLAAAVTARLALGDSLPAAVVTAKAYLTQTLRSSYAFESPAGGTVHALNQGTRW
jgi:hydroxymethylpyrimidine/phosphomethylpyrimidine kinase